MASCGKCKGVEKLVGVIGQGCVYLWACKNIAQELAWPPCSLPSHSAPYLLAWWSFEIHPFQTFLRANRWHETELGHIFHLVFEYRSLFDSNICNWLVWALIGMYSTHTLWQGLVGCLSIPPPLARSDKDIKNTTFPAGKVCMLRAYVMLVCFVYTLQVYRVSAILMVQLVHILHGLLL